MSSIFMGISLHAIGGVAAATCFLPQRYASKWQYQTYWLLFCFFAWLVTPIVVASILIPNLQQVIMQSPTSSIVSTTVYGAIYGFGGMAFGVAIRSIGFSLTYSIAIGISAVVGTVLPAAIEGTLIEGFSSTAGLIVLAGFIISLLGVAICGKAGILKDKENSEGNNNVDMKKGLILASSAGVLSGAFGLALSSGNPISETAASLGSTEFKGYATYIFAMGGAFITNFVWWSVVHFKQNTWKEYIGLMSPSDQKNKSILPKYYLIALLSGLLWYGQFFFYGLGHNRMGNFEFISWGIHMAMLIFFSFAVGFLLKEWQGLSSKTLRTLYFGLTILLLSFGFISYGSWLGS